MQGQGDRIMTPDHQLSGHRIATPVQMNQLLIVLLGPGLVIITISLSRNKQHKNIQMNTNTSKAQISVSILFGSRLSIYDAHLLRIY